jgi:carboxypeptidase Taq
MTKAAAAYTALKARFARVIRIEEAAGWLHWDQSVMMPSGGAEARAEQSSTLAEIAHEIISSTEIADLLDAANPGDDPWTVANLREMRRRHLAATAVPGDLVGALVRAKSASETAWRGARAASSFQQALPAFEKLVGLARQEAEALGEGLNLSPYNALLEQHDQGRRAETIGPVFDRLRLFLAGAIPEIVDKQGAWKPTPAVRAPTAAQKEAATALMHAIGFDFNHGRLDDSLHPFSTGTPDDSRITARWDEGDALSGLMAVLHESGHAAYTRGLPMGQRGQPVGDDAGMTAHESQSLVFEMQAGRSPEMSGFLAALLNNASSDRRQTAKAVQQSLTRVSPGYIRVEADEATYPLHVILRFELEQGLVSGQLRPRDLRDAWNDHVRGYLGLPPPDDADGCLQDIHWYDGAYGYFPTYTLGALAAAQLYQAAEKSIGTTQMNTALAKGDYALLTAFMREHIHGQGRLHASSDDLLMAATGAPLSADAFEAHIHRRYLTD